MHSISLTEFADKINEIVPIMMKEFARIQPQEIYRGKVTLPQILILQHLIFNQPLRMTDIANFMRVSMAATTGIVDRLVKSGYVIRVFDQNDRRIVKIKTTAKGVALMKRLETDRRKSVINIFGKLSEKDRLDYLRVLMRIKSTLTGV